MLFIFDIISAKKRQKLLAELERKLRLNVLFFRIFLALAIIAMAGPKWGLSYSPSEYRRGLDIVFAIDISRSMDILDGQPGASISRLEKGLSIAQETVTSVTGARYAAAFGRGRGYLAVPLTFDSEAALVFLETIDGQSMTGRSTNLESLVEAAADAFQTTSPARRFIVLISDGEAHSGVLRNALNRCVREGISVAAVAVGSDEGREIPVQADDPETQIVISRRDTGVMRSAAERTGGLYIDGSREDASSALSSWLMSFSQESEITSADQNSRKEPKQRRFLFVMLAIIFYAASKFITRTKISGNLNHQALLMICTISLFSSCSQGKLILLEANFLNSRNRHNEAIDLYLRALNHEDASAYAEYGLGLAFYSLDDNESALKHYENSQKLLDRNSRNEPAEINRRKPAESSRPVHRELHFRNHYNSGVVLFEEGDFNSAASAFREALKTDPKRTEAKINLELSLMSISIESNTTQRTEEKQEPLEILFEYIRLEEEQKWRSREWEQEEYYSGLDY